MYARYGSELCYLLYCVRLREISTERFNEIGVNLYGETCDDDLDPNRCCDVITAITSSWKVIFLNKIFIIIEWYIWLLRNQETSKNIISIHHFNV